MAGSQPRIDYPNFGGNFADRQAQQQRLSMALTNSTLDRQLSAIKDLPNIAAIAGPAAADRYASLFGNVPEGTNIVDTPYANALSMANLAYANRRGTKSGSGSDDDEGLWGDMKSSDAIIEYADGRRLVMDSNSAKEALESSIRDEGGLPFKVIQWGKPPTKQAFDQIMTPGAPVQQKRSDTGNIAGANASGTVSGLTQNEDGSWTDTVTGKTYK